jgi:hypothetical protein
MQLMLLEQQNRKRQMMSRKEQDSMMPQPDLSSNIYPQTGQIGGGGPEQFQNIPGGANTTAKLAGYAQNLAPQPASQVQEQQNPNRPMREHQEGDMRTNVPPPPPINRNPFSMNILERAASAGRGTRTPEMRVDGMHPANHMPSSGVLRPYYNGDAAPSNFFGISMASANPTYIHSQPLDIPDESSSDLKKLLAHIEALQRRANALREQEPPQYKILYRLGGDNSSTVYLDAPQWALGQNSSRVLKSSLPLSNVSAYLERHPTVAFVVYRTYDVEKLTSPQLESEGADYRQESGVFPPVEHTEESISIISDDLVLAMTEFLKTAPEFTEVADSISQYAEVPAPYLFIYHSRSVIHQYLEVLPEQRRKRLSCLLEYIYSMYRDEYNEVDSLLQRKKIRLQYIKYLFRPGEVVVERKDQDIRGFYTRFELSEPTVQRTSNKKNNLMASYVEALGCLIGDDKQPSAKVNGYVYSWKTSGWSWKFDGAFSRVYSNLELSLEIHDKQKQSEVDVNDLNLFPLAFADECIKQRLKKRGEMFWKCRFQHLISYHDDDNHDLDRSADERFMIDLMTYRELHKQQSEGQKGNVPADFKDDLGPEMMKRKDPPDEKFIYLLPLSIKGFNLQRKRWVDLQVDRMDAVVWNKKAFKSLVLAHKTKDLIQALISKQLDSEKSTDLIHGKGNGLILLLHGGPGTGKTLTAESVAEIAEKPLYRVTCGDIGTEPEEVEDYFESVLHLGKIWKSVVLLDEADVFLEQRSLDDLRRNALVSIFLRVLEYYDGILVLTSNRVGTFDEAFKSRIQLALHYPKLDHVKRAKVWENFIERLEDLKEENIDFNDLRDNVEELAKNRMNGREIRNAITLARQYTQWKTTKLNFAELQDIIKISGQFDIYLSELNRNITQDQLAQDDGLRLAEADK